MTVKEKLLFALNRGIENSTQSLLSDFNPFDVEQVSICTERAKLEVYRIACLKSVKEQVESATEEAAFQEGMVRYSAILKQAIETWPLVEGSLAPEVEWIVRGVADLPLLLQS